MAPGRVWHDVLAAGFRRGLHKIERLMRAQALRARPQQRGLPKDHCERHPGPMPSNIADRQLDTSNNPGVGALM